jgi:prolyl-tRNA editing enzyme YbaK/EbsC (Cys-tRNA(Pro) deacylase)
MIEEQVTRMLDGLGVPYERMQIDPAFADTAACCEKYGLPLDSAGNTIVVASKKEPRKFGACVVKATTRLDVNHKLMAREWVILGSGSRSSKIKIAPEVFRRIPNATIVPGLALDVVH